MIVPDSAARECYGAASASRCVCGVRGLCHAPVLSTESRLHRHASPPRLPTPVCHLLQVPQYVWWGGLICHCSLPAYLVRTQPVNDDRVLFEMCYCMLT